MVKIKTYFHLNVAFRTKYLLTGHLPYSSFSMFHDNRNVKSAQYVINLFFVISVRFYTAFETGHKHNDFFHEGEGKN